MRLLTWNVARRLQKLDAQAAAVTGLGLDVIALQEVTAASLPRWRAALADAGYEHVGCSLDTAELVRDPVGPRRTGVLVASRASHAVVEGPATPWPEVAHVVRIGELTVCAVHVPNSRNGQIKVQTLHALRAFCEARAGAPLVLCGDFNTPRKETADGEIVTFARDQYGRLRPERGEEWDDAERALLDGRTGVRDVFREVHGYAVKEPSWTWPRWGGGYRLDHVLASAAVVTRGCAYLHELRDSGLSDHSGLVAELSALA